MEESIKVALALAESPTQYADLLHGEGQLPGDMTALLLAASDVTKNHIRKTPFGDIQVDAKQAALFFIEHVMLAHNADHYRALGVERNAPLALIKEHHRLLMRIFHPDRLPDNCQHYSSIATRINQAYNVLRGSESRSHYDASLGFLQRTGTMPVKPPPPPNRQANLADSDLKIGWLERIFAVYRTPLALLAVASIAAAAVGYVYIEAKENTSSSLASPGNSGQLAAPQQTLPLQAREETRLALTTQLFSVPAPKPDERPNTPVESVSNRDNPGSEVRSPHKTSTQVDEPSAAKSQVATTSTGNSGRNLVTPAPVVQEIKPSPPPAPEIKKNYGNVSEPMAVSPPEWPKASQLAALVEEFSEHYRRGDLEKLLKLFSDTYRSEKPGKKPAKAEFTDIIQDTDSRTLYIWDLNWSQAGGTSRGEGSFQSRIVYKGAQQVKVTSGQMSIEVAQNGGRLLITELKAKPELP